MSNQFLQSLAGATTTAAYTYPGGYGLNAPPQATFKNLFGTLLSSLKATPAGMFPSSSIPQGQGYPGVGIPYGAYQNIPGGLAVSSKTQAFTPGAVIVDSSYSQPQIAPPIDPRVQLVGALNPLQGFAGQNLNGIQSPNQSSYTSPLQYQPAGQLGYQQTGAGALSFFLMPILSLFGFVKSLFSMRNKTSLLAPIKIDQHNTDYFHMLDGFGNAQKEEGSFDEYYPDNYETDSLPTENLQAF